MEKVELARADEVRVKEIINKVSNIFLFMFFPFLKFVMIFKVFLAIEIPF
ncbi:hypothetical protein LZ24_01036 [Desulfobotulus alkaliphilus]|uniref:Uncharacterized protein n=1 Tax=Desulfobotulus alkaliphilus TaxID=622671 RepID=A0A562S0J7_9BACT|nr:hypothetical protein LZ24_01036 [Desulfobotulus alkaliphilus]